jgi:hypothetical protein
LIAGQAVEQGALVAGLGIPGEGTHHGVAALKGPGQLIHAHVPQAVVLARARGLGIGRWLAAVQQEDQPGQSGPAGAGGEVQHQRQ